MMPVRTRVALIAGAAAWVGIVLGHLLSYVVVYPETGLRQDHLAATGHGWVTLAGLSLAVAIPAALGLTAAASLKMSAPFRVGALASRLALLQAASFAALELAERGFDAAAAAADPAVVAGIVLQVVVAALAAMVIAVVSRTVRAVAARLRRPERTRERRAAAPVTDEPLVRHSHLVVTRRRAPPLPIAA
jgi:hypothetical protein